ncbi:MAG: protelomerase family protein [Cyanobacteria bacterium P01_H01_bin.153]
MPATTLEKPKAASQGNVAQFKQYTQRGKSTAALKQRIAVFLAKLAQATTVKTVKHLCDEEKSWFCNKYKTPSTRATYMTAYRHAIQDCFADRGISEGLVSERETTQGLVVQHVAMDYMLLPDDYEAIREQTKTKTAEQRDHLTAFDMSSAIAATETALKSEDWRELAAGLIMAVQSRPSDMLKSGDFKTVSKYQVEFTSRAKKRGDKAVGNVWTLVDSVTFIDAFQRLRRHPSVLNLQAKALKDIDSQKNATINRAVSRVFGDIIPSPQGEKELSAKNLRAAGVNVAYHLYGREDQAIGRFAELQLLHDSPSTAANYEDYYCINADGQRVSAVGLREDEELKRQPKSRTTKRPMLDEQVVDDLEALYGTGSTKENVVRAIASAQQAEQLRTENERLKTKLKTAEERIEALMEQRGTELIHIYPESRQAVVETDDIRLVPNADLIGSKRRGAFEERLRRTVEAIQEYNAGRPLEEQIAINAGSLRKIAKGNARAINEWVKGNEAIEAYTNAQGHTYRQNVGKDLSVIKWDDQAYGAYEWPESYFGS